ncbi:MAG: TIGR01777 family oxidoreductase [Phycisphaerales bacterium]|nr:TIGR01777 family oxidoreductase [Phycisphaerales bacterium]
MNATVVIAGGTGFIGQYLSTRFEEDGYQVKIISRQSGHVNWGDTDGILEALEESAILINLAGKAIKTNFTQQNKSELLESRVHTTQVLGNAVLRCKNPPKIWLNASGAHIYGTGDSKIHTEEDALDRVFFPAVMAKAWEDAFFVFHLPNTRQVALRIAIVLGKNGGILQPYIHLTRFFLGGKQGSGKQKFSWIHVEDMYRVILFISVHTEINGALNLCSPNSIDNTTLMLRLRRCMNKLLGCPAPAFAIKLAAALMGIESDLILKSLYVYPKRLLDAGYQFKYASIDDALAQIIK